LLTVTVTSDSRVLHSVARNSKNGKCTHLLRYDLSIYCLCTNIDDWSTHWDTCHVNACDTLSLGVSCSPKVEPLLSTASVFIIHNSVLYVHSIGE